MTLAARILAYVAAHPGCTAEDVERTLGRSAAAQLPALAGRGVVAREKRQVLVRRQARAWCYNVNQQEKR